jgi:hypothetical protein
VSFRSVNESTEGEEESNFVQWGDPREKKTLTNEQTLVSIAFSFKQWKCVLLCRSPVQSLSFNTFKPPVVDLETDTEMGNEEKGSSHESTPALDFFKWRQLAFLSPFVFTFSSLLGKNDRMMFNWGK